MAVKIPLRTHLITENDDIVTVVDRYAGNIAQPGDLVAVAESVVAITQRSRRDFGLVFSAAFLSVTAV